MSANFSAAAGANGTSIQLPQEFPFQDACLTLCYLVGSLQFGYYMFYMLFMGTDALFKASRAFDYEDFDCQRKTVQAGNEFDNNANIATACVGRGNSSSESSETETETADSEAEDGGNGDGDQGSRRGFAVQARERGGDGQQQRQQLQQRRRWRNLRSAPAVGGLRGPLHRLIQSCSCMLVYNSDDEEDDDEDGSESDDEVASGGPPHRLADGDAAIAALADAEPEASKAMEAEAPSVVTTSASVSVAEDVRVGPGVGRPEDLCRATACAQRHSQQHR